MRRGGGGDKTAKRYTGQPLCVLDGPAGQPFFGFKLGAKPLARLGVDHNRSSVSNVAVPDARNPANPPRGFCFPTTKSRKLNQFAALSAPKTRM